jgi:hypothetical protein
MSVSETDFAAGAAIGAVLGVVACLVTWCNTRSNAQEEMNDFRARAIAHQAAHWEIDKNGWRSFHWNLPSTETADDK